MSEFPECLLIVIAEVDTAIEGEWNRWYDTVHLPDALRCPGVRRGRRYVSSGEVSETAAGKTERTARRIYTTIYELDSPDAVATPEFLAMRGWYQFAPRERLLLRLVDELHDTAQVSDGLWQALRAEFTDAQLIELVALTGFYHLISFTTNAFYIPLETYAARFSRYTPER